MSNARELAELGGAYATGGYPHFKNRIINGDMRIDQRNAGASVSSGVGVATYSVDRWWFVGVGAAVTGQRVSGAASGYQYAFQVTGAASNTYAAVVQRIESLNCYDLASQTVTVSVTISSSTLTSLQAILSYAGSADNWTSPTVISTNTLTISSTPTRYTFSVALPANAANGVELRFAAASGITSGTLTITGVQLEKGSTATSFDYRPYGTELALCQRYYSKGSYYCVLPVGSSGVTRRDRIQLPVPMRSTTLTFNDGAGNAGKVYRNSNNQSASVFNYTDIAVAINATTGGAAVGDDLFFNWFCDGEL